ncbi:hypothetical protein HUJ05_008248 [Dendroctonus ponderosae]|nr:hypothetical protein HUJ05_008248 [Dendroctonus ponderosae]
MNENRPAVQVPARVFERKPKPSEKSVSFSSRDRFEAEEDPCDPLLGHQEDAVDFLSLPSSRDASSTLVFVLHQSMTNRNAVRYCFVASRDDAVWNAIASAKDDFMLIEFN